MLSFQYSRLVEKMLIIQEIVKKAICCWIPEKLPKTKTDENNKKKPQMYKVKHCFFRNIIS